MGKLFISQCHSIDDTVFWADMLAREVCTEDGFSRFLQNLAGHEYNHKTMIWIFTAANSRISYDKIIIHTIKMFPEECRVLVCGAV
jgi:hypothetical protein